MLDPILIKKEDGELQAFSSKKLANSLRRVGATDSLISEIVQDIETWLVEGVTTRKIYGRAFALLRKKRKSLAARYSLKKAIMELGPSGYPFEHFMGYIFESMGFQVETGKILQGKCVTHEMDVIATGNKEQHLVECKYYNSQGKYASVQVPLYIRSRINDLVEVRKFLPEYENFTFYGWIATNTRFTHDAMSYGKCSGLKLMSWDYPKDDNIKTIIERENLFPITVLTMLSKAEKQKLLSKGVVLCKELRENPEYLQVLHLSTNKFILLKEEIDDLCNC